MQKEEIKFRRKMKIDSMWDVTQIRSVYGTVVVEYSYDAWGNILYTSGMYADTLGQENPIRYRGYYYDFETGFYYLQSRYYDPAMGRFINADGYINANGDIIYRRKDKII